MESVMIATPTAGGVVKTGYARCLAATVSDLERNGVRTLTKMTDASAIAEQRDVFADDFLRSDFSHLLYIDSDMDFLGTLARTMGGFNLPFVGTVYPKRHIDLAKVIDAAKAGKDASAFGYKFNCSVLNRSLSITNGLCEVATLGFGFVLLTKECLNMIAPICGRYMSKIADREIAGFFQPTDDGPAMTEDSAFCVRWRQAGGKSLRMQTPTFATLASSLTAFPSAKLRERGRCSNYAAAA